MPPVLRFSVLPKAQHDRAQEGLRHITSREAEILQATLDGETSKDMARRLRISPRTADVHRLRALGKLGLQGISELLRFAAAIDRDKAASAPEVKLVDLAQGNFEAEGGVRLGDMLSGIRYVPIPHHDDVSVFMTWDRSGNPAGYLMVPPPVGDRIRKRSMPEPAVTRPLSGALAYGFVIAIDYGRRLSLTGDLTVWEDSWGPLPRSLPLTQRIGAASRGRSTH